MHASVVSLAGGERDFCGPDGNSGVSVRVNVQATTPMYARGKVTARYFSRSPREPTKEKSEVNGGIFLVGVLSRSERSDRMIRPRERVLNMQIRQEGWFTHDRSRFTLGEPRRNCTSITGREFEKSGETSFERWMPRCILFRKLRLQFMYAAMVLFTSHQMRMYFSSTLRLPTGQSVNFADRETKVQGEEEKNLQHDKEQSDFTNKVSKNTLLQT